MKTHLMSASEAVLGRPSGQHGHCRRPVGVEGKRNGLWMLPVLRGKVVHLGYCSAVPDIRTHNTK